MTNFVGPVYELFCRKPKICNGFCKTNFELEPNNQLSDSYHKLVIRHPQLSTTAISGSVPSQSGAGRQLDCPSLYLIGQNELTCQNPLET
jgi:hypothetical protein